MALSMYDYISQTWQNKEWKASVLKKKILEWRHEGTIVRLEKPIRLDRARELGYKAKQGFVVVRVKVRRGGMNKIRPNSGRRPKRMGVYGYGPGKGYRWIAEEKANRKYPNLEVLGSYYVGEDGIYKYYEVILIDPSHPVIKNDPDYKWLQNPANRGRVFRGLTSAGRKVRGLQKSRGLKYTIYHKIAKKQKEREQKKRHEANKYYRLQNYKIPGK
ncbi:50S ribosomal protein L15e [Acidianus sulfidivorans JP7]|uniref:Large ribosomal subunit protein eL15 n=1 Tax=Acidianus sulfidivorans JP7 TaxID=619593 RepID=A0A2U9IMN2_9CREN|nr:50S ribosomal protein L15e [Acidianus sulfidivorans]AWR97266.1 50S ribosomal protein L15e [Acidianus sulfidivorans JP7]